MRMKNGNITQERFEALIEDELMTVQGGQKREHENILIRLRQYVLDLFQAD